MFNAKTQKGAKARAPEPEFRFAGNKRPDYELNREVTKK